MKGQDPLASATLAQLYIAQGHDAKAAETLAGVLARDPEHGQALALRRRLAARSPARVRLTRGRDALIVEHEAADVSMHAVVAMWRAVGATATAEPVRSRPCMAGKGRITFPVGRGAGSACACLARLLDDGRLSVITVAEPLSWGPSAPESERS